MVRICGVGVCCQDYIVSSPRVEWGDTALVSSYHAQGGGLIGTALVACARLGASCDLFSLLGADAIADEITAELQREGIDTSGVQKKPGGESPFSFIHVDEASGDRTIFHRPGSNLHWDSSLSMPRIADSQTLIIDDIYPEMSLAAARLARAHHIPVVADIIPAPQNHELLRYIDVLIVPKHYAYQNGYAQNLDAALDSIHACGPTTAVITLGSEGYVYSDPTSRGVGKAFKVDAVDTTGAGDSFHGAFAYGLASGWDTARCAEFASAVAAIKCQKQGGRTGLPSLEQTLAFIEDRRV